jgi:hypothetical protein
VARDRADHVVLGRNNLHRYRIHRDYSPSLSLFAASASLPRPLLCWYVFSSLRWHLTIEVTGGVMRATDDIQKALPRTSPIVSWHMPEISDSLSMIALFAIVLLSRLPFLVNGYGTDPDAWRVLETAHLLASEGVYQPSRFPGYPILEFTFALLFRLGIVHPALWNSIGAIFSASAAVFFYLIYKRSTARPAPFLAAVAVSMVPVVYIASTTSMDYIWALSFVLGSAWLLLEGHYAVGGVLLGLAIACRLTSAAFLLPAVLLISIRVTSIAGTLRNTLRYAIPSLVIAGLLYTPAALKFGAGFLTFSDTYPSLLAVAARASVRTFGPVGALAMLIATGIAGVTVIMNRHLAAARLKRSPEAVAAALYCALIIAIYLRLPHEAGYLIPIVPFALLLLADLLQAKVMIGLLLALTVSPFIGNIDNTGKLSARGMIFQDRAERLDQMCLAEKGAAFAATLPMGHYLIVAHLHPQLVAAIGDNPTLRSKILYGVLRRTVSGYEISGGQQAPPDARFHILAEAIPAMATLGYYHDETFERVHFADCGL